MDCIQPGKRLMGKVIPQKIITSPRMRKTNALASLTVITRLAKANPNP